MKKRTIKIGKIIASLVVGITIGVLVHKSGTTEWLAKNSWNNQILSETILKDISNQIWIYSYNFFAGSCSALATYFTLDKYLK